MASNQKNAKSIFPCTLVIQKSSKKKFKIPIDLAERFGDVDEKIRLKLNYDYFDHCSAFYEDVPFTSRTIAEVFIDGTGINQKSTLGELGIFPGSQFTYVYDFGDCKTHKVSIE